MTARIVVLLCFVGTASAVHAIDLKKLTPMNETKLNHDVELKGRELEAMESALRQFRQDRFSVSGDLKHFTIYLTREPGTLFVTFFPDPDRRELTHFMIGAASKYGTCITYAVSLRTLKIIGYHFDRD